MVNHKERVANNLRYLYTSEELAYLLFDSMSATAKLEELLGQSLERVEELEAESLQAVAEKVCRDIPEDWTISVWMEKGAGWVDIVRPSGRTITTGDGVLPLAKDIDKALEYINNIEKGIPT